MEKREDDEWWRDMVTAMAAVVVVHAWCFLTQPHLETKSQDSLAFGI